MNENKKKDLHETQKDTNTQLSIDEESLKILVDLAKERIISISRTYFWGTIIGIIVGAVFCIAGFIITVMGLTGSIEWLLQVGNFTSKLANAGPGVFFALVGMLILWRYKPKGKERIRIGPIEIDAALEKKKMEIRLFEEDEQKREENKGNDI